MLLSYSQGLNALFPILNLEIKTTALSRNVENQSLGSVALPPRSTGTSSYATVKTKNLATAVSAYCSAMTVVWIDLEYWSKNLCLHLIKLKVNEI
jgi:hypothetical protein